MDRSIEVRCKPVYVYEGLLLPVPCPSQASEYWLTVSIPQFNLLFNFVILSLEKEIKMGSAPAQIPTSFGHELRACLRCRLVKTYDQVKLHSFSYLFPILHVVCFLFIYLFKIILFFRRTLFSFFPLETLWFKQAILGFAFVSELIPQFRESGCENCPFFKMEEDHERVVDCTTPNFNGYGCWTGTSVTLHP